MGQGKLKRSKPGSRKERKESQVKAVKEAKKLAELHKSAEHALASAVAPETLLAEQTIR